METTFYRKVKVNLSRTTQEEDCEVFFFKLANIVNCEDLEEEYTKRGLKPCDFITLSRMNEEDRAFADKYPNSTQRKNAEGKFYATFYRCENLRDICVRLNHSNKFFKRFTNYLYDPVWWHAGLPL